MSDETETSVWLVEDHTSFRRAMVRAINKASGMTVREDLPSCEEALAALESTSFPPDVVLLDVGLPGMSGIEGITRLREQRADLPIILLTVFDDEEKVLNAIRAGASGYLLKTSTSDEITAGIREVLDGGAPMNSRVARMVLDEFSGKTSRSTAAAADYHLTERETGILQLMVDGLIKKEIADRLEISFHTVDTHLRHIYEKLQVNTQTGVVAKALREGLAE